MSLVSNKIYSCISKRLLEEATRSKLKQNIRKFLLWSNPYGIDEELHGNGIIPIHATNILFFCSDSEIGVIKTINDKIMT